MARVQELQLKMPFSVLVSLLEQLGPEDLLELRELVDEKLLEYEDELMLANPRIMSEIREARAEYEAGEYITFQELMAEPDQANEANV